MKRSFGSHLYIAMMGIFAGILIYFTINGEGRNPNSELKKAVMGLQGEQVTLEEVIPFQWEEAVFISPSATKEEIEKELGVISENINKAIYEKKLNLLFINKKEVVTGILAGSEELDYDIRYGNFPSQETESGFKSKAVAKIAHGKKTVFLVKKEGERVILERKSLLSLAEAFTMNEKDLLQALQGAKSEELIEEWGKFSSPFSGMFGYIWSNGEKNIGVYFDIKTDEVNDVKIFHAEKK